MFNSDIVSCQLCVMDSNGDEASQILRELEKLKLEKIDLERRISVLQTRLGELNEAEAEKEKDASISCPALINGARFGHGLSPDMIYRYSRHLLLSSFGVQGQSSLVKSSILVVGAGGLGAPALLYLAACGVGRIGIVDHDVVELNNLHRQIIHTEAFIGQSKVESAAAACRAINSTVHIEGHEEALRTSNALEILSKYDIVIDATDNVPSRYLISDCCVVLGKPLVSGAALGLEGQLTVYNHNGGPCYRCLFPTPPPTTACQSCSDSGVLGVVPGIIGCLQALEAIKVATTIGEPLSGRMLLLDAISARIRIVKIRGRCLECESCGENAKFTQKLFREFDYEKFTQSPLKRPPVNLNLLPANARISTVEYKERVIKGEAHVLVDVRPAHHFKIVSLPKSLNIPLSSLESKLPDIHSALKQEEERTSSGSGASLYVICRRGNDSQRAIQCLHKMGLTSARDIIGGIEAWARDVNPNFPTY